MIRQIFTKFINFFRRSAEYLVPKHIGEIYTNLPESNQESVRDIEAVKRTRKMFDEKVTEILARSKVAHGWDCYDPGTCTKKDCYKWVADKIVNETYLVDTKTLERVEDVAVAAENKSLKKGRSTKVSEPNGTDIPKKRINAKSRSQRSTKLL